MYVPSIRCLIFLKECKTWLYFLSLKANEDEFLEIILIKIYISCTWKRRVELHLFVSCDWTVQLEEKAAAGDVAAGLATFPPVCQHALLRAEKHGKCSA